ncbi:MAG: cytochrome c biogenesis protein CcsA [Planctomycetes bacterium]|nr:cytochrome c biogenesis protein CcsA [Planctomycetota bacterium]
MWMKLAAGLTTGAILAIFFWAPTEVTMGGAQRIVYVHVPLAWLSLAGMLATAGCGIAYLTRRDLAWDHWAQAAAELGWVACGLTLVSGSLWAKAAWNTWWAWDPRLTSALILWTLYSGYLILRTSVEDPHRRARLGAVVAIVGTMDIPLVVMATRWFRGIHPMAPEMEPAMRVTLLLSVVALSALFGVLLVRRRGQLLSANRISVSRHGSAT